METRDSALDVGRLSKMEWKDAISDLVKQVEAWLHDEAENRGGFAVSVSPLEPSADNQVLQVTLPTGTRVILEPAYFAEGVLPTAVDLYAYPTLRRVRLIGPTGAAWEVQSSQGVPLNYKWNRDDFIRLITALADEPVSDRI